jgi:hypothetical protein
MWREATSLADEARISEVLSGQRRHENGTEATPDFCLPSLFKTTAEAPLSRKYGRLYADARSRFAPPVRPDAGVAT